MNKLLNEMLLGDDWSSQHCRETDSSYEYEFNLAGFKKKSIKASVLNNIATVEARQGDKEFRRRFYLPKNLDLSSCSLRYEDGVLYLKINKNEKAKKVELKIS